YKTDPLCQAGITVVVAAGNAGRDNSVGSNGYGTITSPGNDPLVITVGAVNHKSDSWRGNDVIATYSSKGPSAVDWIVKPDIVAPGNKVGSNQAPNATLATQFPNNRLKLSELVTGGTATASPDFFWLSGTSMAAPVVSGAAALLIGRDASLTPDQVKFRLMKTAWRGFPTTATIYDAATNQYHSASHDIFTVGAGMLDIWAAWNNFDRPTGTAASPSAYYDSVTKKVMLKLNSTNATNLIWGTTGTGATNLVWGTATVSGLNIIWGTNLVWGTSTMSGFNFVWGTTSPWANASPQTESLSIAINGEN
ncbi:MAG: hypothetical protein FJW39_34580, partial [Acidobacteria bacterium]|nr:hypothetical protein [Acidobacteriota bacterium]